MKKEKTSFIISTLAIYQTDFWSEIGTHLKSQGHNVFFLSFDDRSTESLEKKGFQVYSVSHYDKEKTQKLLSESDKIFQSYGLKNINSWLTHERYAFDIKDSNLLKEKLLTYLTLAERAYKDIPDKNKTLIQELGGFISVIACFFAAQKHGIENWFIEPSFFKGRLFFIKDSFLSAEIKTIETLTPNQELRKYLSETLNKQSIVIPTKDKHHYSSAIKKILSSHNFRRLFEKTFDKYFLGKHQEFGHIGSHVLRHIKMLINSIKLNRLYTKLDDLGDFIYYPLHVPGDMALTIRSPQFLDQLSLIDYIARNIPATHCLAIKEHPAMIGSIDIERLKQLTDRYDNIFLLNPATNNYDVIKRCDAIISVNSKSGAEGILLDKPVLVLGDAFYTNSPMVTTVRNISEIEKHIKSCIKDFSPKTLDEKESYFGNVWNQTYEGELYVVTPDNTSKFSKSLLDAIIAPPPHNSL